MADVIQHLPRADKWQEPGILTEIYIFQSHLDGLYTLIQWLDGYLNGAGQGEVPGRFELIMHYRELCSRIQKEYKKRERQAEEGTAQKEEVNKPSKE